MSLLRYFIIDSLTFGREIQPNTEDSRRIKLIYLMLVLQLLVYYIGSVLLFYFILENWFFSMVVGLLFTFIYFSISMVLFSGLRMSSYIKKSLKKHTNKLVIIGNSTIEVNEVGYEEETNKNGLIAALILRFFFIIVFGFFIFIGLILGISLYTQPNLDEEHSSQIIKEYEFKSGTATQLKINLLTNKIASYNTKKAILESNYTAAIDGLKFAKDDLHRIFMAHDTAYFHKAITDWDFSHHTETEKIPSSIHKLQLDYKKGYEKIKFITEHKKFGIYRINEFKGNKPFAFWSLFLVVSVLFIAPYVIRFIMIFKKVPLDIALEDKMISTIKKDYRLHHQEMQVEYKKYGIENPEIETLYDEAPFHKRKNDDGEMVAIKNQLNVFLNNEL